MRRILTLSALLLLVSLTACAPDLDDQLSDLVLAKDAWMSAVPNQSYSYTLVRRCFCTGDGKELRLKVRNGVVLFNKDRSVKPDSINTAGHTMQKHFETILEFLKLQQSGEGVLDVIYNQEIGHPALIKWTASGKIDSDFTVEILEVSIDSRSGS